MAANFASPRHRRRYQVNESGVAEFDWDYALRRFIPWYEVAFIDKDHQTDVFSIVCFSDRRLTPKLERLPMKQCFAAVNREWHLRAPHVYREHCVRNYRALRQALLVWIPSLVVGPYLLLYLSVWLLSRHGLIFEQGAWTKPVRLFVIGVVGLPVLWLVRSKFLRQNFDEYYADIEANLALDPAADRTSSRETFSFRAILRRWLSLVRPTGRLLRPIIQWRHG